MRRSLLPVTVLFVSSLLLAAGCGSGDDDADGSPDGSRASKQPAAAAGDSAADEHRAWIDTLTPECDVEDKLSRERSNATAALIVKDLRMTGDAIGRVAELSRTSRAEDDELAIEWERAAGDAEVAINDVADAYEADPASPAVKEANRELARSAQALTVAARAAGLPATCGASPG